MAHERPPHQRLFAELQRRKVLRVVAVYGAVAFALIQVADPVAEALRLPEWFLPTVIALLLLGFPLAVAMAWALEMTPEGVRRARETEPEELERIASQPRARRWVSGLLAVAGVVVLVLGAWFGGRAAATEDGGTVAEPVGPADRSIAVLPFADMSPGGDQEYFSDGISEELLNLLAKVPELRVAARTSSFSFEGEGLPITEIADRLDVAHVLEGSVRKAGDRIRVTAQLIRAEDGFHVWSETWDRTLEDVFAIQDEIAADVVGQLRIELLDEAPTVAETDPEAYRLVLQARHLADRASAASLDRAEKLFHEALAIDPDYAPAWAGLAVARYGQAPATGAPWDSLAPLVRDAATRALEADPENGLAHSILGTVATLAGDLTSAARHHRRALDLDPGIARVVGAAAATLMTLGRPDEAIPLMEYRVRRDPVGMAGYQNLGLGYMSARRFGDAAEAFRTALDLNPAAGGVQSMLGMALLQQGRPEEALEVTLRDPVEFWRLLTLVEVYHALGRHEDSDAALARVIEEYEHEAAFNIAYVLAYRGEEDRAFEWLDRAVEYDDPGLSEILVFPEFDALRDDPRWDAFLERIGRSPDDLAAIDFDVELPEPAPAEG